MAEGAAELAVASRTPQSSAEDNSRAVATLQRMKQIHIDIRFYIDIFQNKSLPRALDPK
jgi:hypothetical protein